MLLVSCPKGFDTKSLKSSRPTGGPDVKSKDFLRATHVIRKEVERQKICDLNSEPKWPEQDALIESANWEIAGYAKGI